MRGAINQAQELAASTPNSWIPQQFENPANPAVHERTTGKEIWEDTAGRVDLIVAGVGTGANVAAAARLAAKPENRGKVIVTVAASFGERYLSTPLFQGLGNEAVLATPAFNGGDTVMAASRGS